MEARRDLRFRHPQDSALVSRASAVDGERAKRRLPRVGQDPVRRMRILLFGKGGQVGWELQRSLAPLGEVVALDHDSADGLCGSFTDLSGLAETVRRVA